MAGLEKVPLRIPSQWDPVWFEKFVRDFLSLADVRNAIPGDGITVTGNSSEPATISSSGPPGSIANAEYTLLAADADLPNARVLRASPGVIDLNDAGAGDSLTIGLVHGGVDDVFLRDRAALSVMGRPLNTLGTVGDIISTGDKAVLHQSGSALSFDLTDSSYISDFIEAAQDAVGATLTNTATVHLTYNDGANQITADVQASATLDVIGSTRGDILYRGASGWAVLAPSTSGDLLQTNGAGADPSWVAPPSGGSGALTLIGSSTAGSAVASLTVGSIPNTYTHLYVVVVGRGTTAAGGVAVAAQFNGDTGTNYEQEAADFGNTGATFTGAITQTSVRVGAISAANAPSNRAGIATFTVGLYASTTFDKPISGKGGNTQGTTTTTLFSEINFGTWHPATPAAITSVTVLPSAGNFATGTKVSIYGVS